MRLLLPTILIILSGGAFFGFIDPAYQRVQDLQKDERLFEEALNNSKELQAVRDNLISQYNSFPASNIDRLEKMVPDHVDNVRLVRDLDGIAAKYGMELNSVVVETGQRQSASIADANETQRHDSVRIRFNVTAPYNIFLQFLDDIERSLRIADVTSVTFSADERDLYEYSVTIRTYWLR